MCSVNDALTNGLDYEEGTSGSRVQSTSQRGRFGEPRLDRLTTSTSLHPTPFPFSKYLPPPSSSQLPTLWLYLPRIGILEELKL